MGLEAIELRDGQVDVPSSRPRTRPRRGAQPRLSAVERARSRGRRTALRTTGKSDCPGNPGWTRADAENRRNDVHVARGGVVRPAATSPRRTRRRAARGASPRTRRGRVSVSPWSPRASPWSRRHDEEGSGQLAEAPRARDGGRKSVDATSPSTDCRDSFSPSRAGDRRRRAGRRRGPRGSGRWPSRASTSRAPPSRPRRRAPAGSRSPAAPRRGCRARRTHRSRGRGRNGRRG